MKKAYETVGRIIINAILSLMFALPALPPQAWAHVDPKVPAHINPHWLMWVFVGITVLFLFLLYYFLNGGIKFKK